jgi:stage II sporulation protein GA (sporulation sigma-E factor processing peptidase)
VEIYAEYLFLENFFIGIIILMLSAKVGGLKTCKKRLVLGGTLCGFFSFVIFIQNIAILLSISMKIAFAVLLSFVVFDKKLMKATVMIYVVSALMGGITIMIMYIGRIRGLTNNAVVYIGEVSYLNIIAGVVISYLVLISFSSIFKEKQLKERVFTDISVVIGGAIIKHRALIDSGNFLRDPITGKPVIILSKSAAIDLKKLKNIDLNSRYCIVPYKAIGVENGLLEAYRADNAYVNGCALGSIILAIYNTEFCNIGEDERYQVLISRDILREGVA